LSHWITAHTTEIIIWLGALSTFAIYSILYRENKFYRLFEHILIGLGTGWGVYVTWSEWLGPKWWAPMVGEGKWYLAFAAVFGSMFYFIYSKKHMWISRVIFGVFMGLSAGSMFKFFYGDTFPQIGASMKPIAGNGMSGWDTLNVIIIYVILLSCMSYFFFSFEHKSWTIKRSAAMGRWFLMIGFGAIFGATVMGRMTLFIGRFDFLLNDWRPEAVGAWNWIPFRVAVVLLAAAAVAWVAVTITRRRSTPPSPPDAS
jgi:hypothetical protein